MEEADLTPLKKLERRSIVTSKDFLMDDRTEPHFSYLLDNLLTQEDIRKIMAPKPRTPRALFRKTMRLKSYLENTKNKQFTMKYSSFSLIPDLREDVKLVPDASRMGTLENIISEEQIRKTLGNEGFKKITCVQTRESTNQAAAFLRIKRKLDNMRRFCPKLFYAEDDIFTLWGNLKFDVTEKVNKYL